MISYCMAINTRSHKVIESKMETKTPLFGQSKEYKRENEATGNKENNTLSNIENECSDDDRGKLKYAEEESIEKEAPPQKFFTRVIPFPQKLEKMGKEAKLHKFLSTCRVARRQAGARRATRIGLVVLGPWRLRQVTGSIGPYAMQNHLSHHYHNGFSIHIHKRRHAILSLLGF